MKDVLEMQSIGQDDGNLFPDNPEMGKIANYLCGDFESFEQLDSLLLENRKRLLREKYPQIVELGLVEEDLSIPKNLPDGVLGKIRKYCHVVDLSQYELLIPEGERHPSIEIAGGVAVESKGEKYIFIRGLDIEKYDSRTLLHEFVHILQEGSGKNKLTKEFEAYLSETKSPNSKYFFIRPLASLTAEELKKIKQGDFDF